MSDQTTTGGQEETKKGAKEDPKKGEAAAPEVGQMKRGDYLIHVFIEQARKMKCSEGNTVDPLVEVNVLNVKKYTTAKDDIGDSGLCKWNEHLFFEPRNVTVEEIEQAKISVRVLDKGFFKEAVIGAYEFDVAYIYFMAKHSLLHRWIALSNPESQNFNEITGYLKLSISVTTKGDETIQISEDSSAPDKSDTAIMMPPQIKPEYYQVKFRFFFMEKLPMMDNNILGKPVSIDAYLLCQYLSHKLVTETVTAKEGVQIACNYEFLIPVQLPVMSGRIVMKIFDKDAFNDEIVGSFIFNLKDCLDPKISGRYIMRNIYGSHLGPSGQITEMMNENPEAAACWKGRIFVQIISEKTEKPTCLKRVLDKEEAKKAMDHIQRERNLQFDIIAEVCQGIALPEEDQYTVMIKIADVEMRTGKPKIQQKNYNRWSQRFKETLKAPYKDIDEIGTVFVYLMDGDKQICYYKGNASDFKDKNAVIKWVELTNDLSIGKIKDSHKAGMLSFKLSIHQREKGQDKPFNFEVPEYAAWKNPPPKRLKVFKARCYIYQCRDLPSADDDGQSDPFINVWQQNSISKTQCIEDNNNPIFFETLEIPIIEAETEDDLPPFILDVYDRDTFSDDFIGRCIVPVKDCNYTKNNALPREPKWHACRTKPGGPQQGEILVSFSIVLDDYTYDGPAKMVRLQQTVTTKEFQIDVNILGLRELQSVGILPVKKAFVMFNLKSLVAPEDGRALVNIRTQPGPTGANPTINSMISFRLPLPTSPLFCPKLVCQVYDYIFMGMNQPLIGTFTIPIGDLIYALKDERAKETRAIEYINEELSKILKDEGITTYNIQTINERNSESPLSQRPLDNFMAKELFSAKTKMNVDEEMKQPLLEGITLEEKKRMSYLPRTTYLPRRSNEIAEDRSISLNQRPRGPSRINTIGGKEDTGNASKKRNPYEKVDKFNGGQKAALLSAQKEEEEKWKREMKDIRLQEQEEFKRSGGNAHKNVIMAKYMKDERLDVPRECQIPPESMYIGFGWDENPPLIDEAAEMALKIRRSQELPGGLEAEKKKPSQQVKKHYRRYYTHELETVKEIMPVESPFSSYEIMRGQSRGASKSWWPFGQAQKQDDSGEVSTEQIVGKFKGTVTVQSEDDLAAYNEKKRELVDNLRNLLNQLSLKKLNKPIDMRLQKLASSEGRAKFEVDLEELGVAHLQVTKQLADLYSDQLLNQMLLTQMKCLIRVYIISAFNLSSRDNGSESDPYLIVSCNNKEFNERDNYQENEPNPDFYKCFQFEGTFPGCAPLVIKVMDYDDIFGDDSIGTTTVDLEDRYFSPEWQSIKHKPIEYRQLYHPSSSISQGTVKMWVQIIPTTIPLNEVPMYDITPKPADDFEVRLSIFDTLDVKAMDTLENMSDIYCRAFFDSAKDAKETDTHYRCQNGKASFNYRLLYNVKFPSKNQTLSIQLYDRDFFKSNDIIGEANIDLKMPIEDAYLSKKIMSVTKNYYNKYYKENIETKLDFKDDKTFWVPIMSDGKVNGKVRVQIDIYPKDQAEKNKVGEARQDPNHSPFLPPPVGRLSLSLNPLTMIKNLIGPALYRKIMCTACLIACCALCIALLPLIFANVLSALINKGLGIQ